MSGATHQTLYEWAGGTPALEKLFDRFYAHVAAWVGEVLGGPKTYSTTRGGHAHMISRHVGRGITEEQRRRWVNLLLDTADEVGLPADPEFRASFVGYLEWGSRLAVLFSAPGADAPAPEEMPTWDWAKPPWEG